MNVLVNLNLNKNEIQNAVMQPLATAPSNPKLGQIYYNSGDKLLYIYNGSAWAVCGAVTSVAGKTGAVTLVKGDVGLGNVDNTSDATKKTNFTGSIADGNTGFVTGDAVFDALALKLNLSGGTMSGAIAMGSNKITGLGTPTNDGDASTKGYVDTSVSTAISGLGAILRFMGTAATTSALPTSNMKKGDVYIVTADNSEWVWTSDSASGTFSNYEMLGITSDLSGYLPLSGGTMTGAIAMGSKKITGLAAGTANGDAVRYEQLTGLIKTQTGTIGTSATSVEVSFTGTLINAYATMNGNEVELDKAIASNKVTFSTAQNPSAAVTCVVVYA